MFYCFFSIHFHSACNPVEYQMSLYPRYSICLIDYLAPDFLIPVLGMITILNFNKLGVFKINSWNQCLLNWIGYKTSAKAFDPRDLVSTPSFFYSSALFILLGQYLIISCIRWNGGVNVCFLSDVSIAYSLVVLDFI